MACSLGFERPLFSTGDCASNGDGGIREKTRSFPLYLDLHLDQTPLRKRAFPWRLCERCVLTTPSSISTLQTSSASVKECVWSSSHPVSTGDREAGVHFAGTSGWGYAQTMRTEK